MKESNESVAGDEGDVNKGKDNPLQRVDDVR